MAYQHIICCLELYLPGTVWGWGGDLISQALVVFISFFADN